MLEINKLHLGDCLEVMNDIDDNSIDLVITSPPYFNVKKYSYWNTYDDYLKFLKKVFKKIFFILVEGRMCCVNLSVIIQPRLKRSLESKRIPIPFHFVTLMEEIGFKFLEDIIWVKPEPSCKNRNGGFFRKRQPVQYKPNVINEYVLVFQKPSDFLIDKILKNYTMDIKEKSLVNENYERTNIWNISPSSDKRHPAIFPELLVLNLIKYYSYVNDIIVDPFLGIGTTIVACKKLNRKYIGIEKEEKYFNIAQERIKNHLEGISNG